MDWRRSLGQVVTLYLAGKLFYKEHQPSYKTLPERVRLHVQGSTCKAPTTAGVFITAVTEDTEGVTIILVYVSQ